MTDRKFNSRPVHCLFVGSNVCVYVQCIIWNVADESILSEISVHRDTIYSISWNHDGSAFATTCKDRVIRVIDPRSGDVIAVRVNSHFCYAAIYRRQIFVRLCFYSLLLP